MLIVIAMHSKAGNEKRGDEEDQEMVTVSLFSLTNENNSSNIGETKISRSKKFQRLNSDSSHAMDVEDDGSDIVFRSSESDRPIWNVLWDNLQNERKRMIGGLFVFIICVIPLIITVGVLAHQLHSGGSDSANISDGNGDSEWDQYAVLTDKGAVATDSLVCSQIGAAVLDKGGNAMDAAVASALCLGVVSPAASGIGGGCYILSHNASSGVSEFIDSRERAPAAAYPDMFAADPMKAQLGGLAVAVLAEVKGLHLAWSRYGSKRVSWSTCGHSCKAVDNLYRSRCCAELSAGHYAHRRAVRSAQRTLSQAGRELEISR